MIRYSVEPNFRKGEYFSLNDCAHFFGMAAATWRFNVKVGTFPNHCRLGGDNGRTKQWEGSVLNELAIALNSGLVTVKQHGEYEK